MMSRKIEALQEAAASKSRESAERVAKALAKMIKQGQIITFKSVATAANVSTAYLYKQIDLRNQIEVLRGQQKNSSKPKQPPLASDNSKAVIIYNLREDNKRLRADIDGLRRVNESLTGRLYQLQDASNLAERLRAENESLRQQLDECRRRAEIQPDSIPLTNSKDSKVTSLDKKRTQRLDISDKIKSDLAQLGIPLNSTLTKTIKSASVEIVESAIVALKEAMTTGNVERPGGWLNKAIKDGWIPNEKHLPQNKVERDIFNEWFSLAYKRRLVLASVRGDDGQLYVYTVEGIPLPFKQMLVEYPLEKLQATL